MLAKCEYEYQVTIPNGNIIRLDADDATIQDNGELVFNDTQSRTVAGFKEWSSFVKVEKVKAIAVEHTD